jgi:glycerol uptake facilitator-like aquaporin
VKSSCDQNKMPRAFPYLATKVCNILAPFAMEFVGTFFLVAAVGFNSVSAHPLAPLGIGLTLVVCIFAGGHISGSALPPHLLCIALAFCSQSFLGW